ncbi:hypothetical protein LINPERHAP2_LOCUS6851 [Linum perenne]
MLVMQQLHPVYVRWHAHTPGRKVPTSGIRVLPVILQNSS